MGCVISKELHCVCFTSQNFYNPISFISNPDVPFLYPLNILGDHRFCKVFLRRRKRTFDDKLYSYALSTVLR